MAQLTLRVNSNTNYIEKVINIAVSGTSSAQLPSNSYLQIYYNTGSSAIPTPIFIHNQKITTIKEDILLTTNGKNLIYNHFINTPNVPLNFGIYHKSGSTYELISNVVSKTMKIEPLGPTFNETPVYRVIDEESLSFTNNDNQMIVRGLSTVEITKLVGTAHKGALIRTIKVNNTELESYEDAINFNPSLYPTGCIMWGYTGKLNGVDPAYLDITLIDSRNFSRTYRIADISKFKYSYQKPKISSMVVEHDNINETTTLNISGYYSEGYQLGFTNLTSEYSFIENISGAVEQQGITPLTITKTISSEFQNFSDISVEYNNPSYLIDENNKTYYEKSTFENNIQSLFNTSLYYNGAYTKEYLQADYDSTNERYYILSGGYSTKGWSGFWLDTLNEIYQIMYADNTYHNSGLNIIGNENGGNYEFEITATIQGDIQSGFSLDKTFYITAYINDGIKSVDYDFEKSYKNTSMTRRTELLPTAIPAIDVYKDNIAIHGFYNEQVGGTQIEGSKLADFVIEFDTDGTWIWRKWQSGYVELFTFHQFTGLNITTQSAGTYYGANGDITLPFTLTELYAQSGQLGGTVSSGIYTYKIYTINSGTKLRTEFRAHASLSNASCGVKYYLIGMYNRKE